MVSVCVGIPLRALFCGGCLFFLCLWLVSHIWVLNGLRAVVMPNKRIVLACELAHLGAK